MFVSFVTSFVIGVASGLVANFVYERLFRRDKQ